MTKKKKRQKKLKITTLHPFADNPMIFGDTPKVITEEKFKAAVKVLTDALGKTVNNSDEYAEYCVRHICLEILGEETCTFFKKCARSDELKMDYARFKLQCLMGGVDV